MVQDFDKWFDSLTPQEQKEYVEEMEADSYLASGEYQESLMM